MADDERDERANTSAETSETQSGRGVCDVCGADAYHPFAKRCEEHREAKKDRAPRPEGRKRRRGRPPGGGQPSVERELRELLEGFGMLAGMGGLPTVAYALAGDPAQFQAPEPGYASKRISKIVAQQAKRSARWQQGVEYATTGGVVLQLFAAVAPLLMAAQVDIAMRQQLAAQQRGEQPPPPPDAAPAGGFVPPDDVPTAPANGADNDGRPLEYNEPGPTVRSPADWPNG